MKLLRKILEAMHEAFEELSGGVEPYVILTTFVAGNVVEVENF